MKTKIFTSSTEIPEYYEYNYRLGLIYLIPLYNIRTDWETAMNYFEKASVKLPEAGAAKNYIIKNM